MAKGVTDYFEDARKAAKQASLDLDQFAKRSAGGEGGVAGPLEWSTYWAAVSAGTSVLALGLQLATLVLSRFPVTPDEPKKDAVEIQIVNNTTVPVVLFSYESDDGEIVRVPGPVLPGESDVVVLANAKDFFDDTAFVSLKMLVGVGDPAVEVVAKYEYDGDRWGLTLDIDPDGLQPKVYDHDLELCGASFVAHPETGVPSFSVYSGTTQKGTGTMTLALYDYAAPQSPPSAVA